MSSAFVATPLGNLPKQENFKIAGIFNTGFIEFDQNIIFLNTMMLYQFLIKILKIKILEIYLNDPLKADRYKKKLKN